MTSTNVFLMAIVLIMVTWSTSVFFNAMEGDVLWKQMASGIAALVFWVLFVLSALKLIRTAKAVNEQIRQSHSEA